MSNGTFKLSNQAVGALMMALQESLLNQLDIVPIIKGFELQTGDEGLVVTNPPTVRVSNNQAVTEEDLTTMAGEQLPRYRYKCEGCEQEFVALHSFSDVRESCDLCGHESITKMLGKPIVLNKKLTNSKDTGSLTNEYIEANRELLKDMKEEVSNGFYEQT